MTLQLSNGSISASGETIKPIECILVYTSLFARNAFVGEQGVMNCILVDERRMCRPYEKSIPECSSRESPVLNARAPQNPPRALDDGVGSMLSVLHGDSTLSCGSKVLIL